MCTPFRQGQEGISGRHEWLLATREENGLVDDGRRALDDTRSVERGARFARPLQVCGAGKVSRDAYCASLGSMLTRPMPTCSH